MIMAYNPLGSRPGGVGSDRVDQEYSYEHQPLGSRPGMVGSQGSGNSPWNFADKMSLAISGIKDRFGFGTDVPETKTFDPSDAGQVGEMQEFLTSKGYKDSEGNDLVADSKFGPKTQAAYRNYVNDERIGRGLDPYTYDDAKQPMDNVNMQDSYDENNPNNLSYDDIYSVPFDQNPNLSTLPGPYDGESYDPNNPQNIQGGESPPSWMDLTRGGKW